MDDNNHMISQLDSLPRVPTSRFASIKWPAWSQEILNKGYSHPQLFGGGIMYILHWLQSEDIRARLDPAINEYVAKWNPTLTMYTRKWNLMVRANTSRFATFHNGATWILWKLRMDMPKSIAEQGLSECLDVMEVGVHKEYILLIEAPDVSDVMRLLEDLDLGESHGAAENDAAGQNGGPDEDNGLDEAASEDHESWNMKDAGAKTIVDIGIENGGSDGFAILERLSGRARNRAKSKKAKKAAKKVKGNKAAEDE